MKSFRVGVLAMLLLSAATAVFGMSVESDYMKDFDLSKMRTFAFKTDRVGLEEPTKIGTHETIPVIVQTEVG